MATKETKTKTITCDICRATIKPEDQRILQDDLEVTIGMGGYMEYKNTIRVKLCGLDIPYGKSTDKPDVCRKCTVKVLKRALDTLSDT